MLWFLQQCQLKKWPEFQVTWLFKILFTETDIFVPCIEASIQ